MWGVSHVSVPCLCSSCQQGRWGDICPAWASIKGGTVYLQLWHCSWDEPVRISWLHWDYVVHPRVQPSMLSDINTFYSNGWLSELCSWWFFTLIQHQLCLTGIPVKRLQEQHVMSMACLGLLSHGEGWAFVEFWLRPDLTTNGIYVFWNYRLALWSSFVSPVFLLDLEAQGLS